jgi:hypothetical protein
MDSLVLESPKEVRSPVVLRRNELDEIRISRVRYRRLEWTILQLWELDPGHDWELRSTVALKPHEWKAVLAAFGPKRTPSKRGR